MPYNFAADSFHTKKLCSRLSSSEVRCWRKNGRFAFLSPPLGDLEATYDDHLRLFGKRVVDFLLVLIELFPHLWFFTLWMTLTCVINRVIIIIIIIGVTAEALRVIICSKSAISLQRGSVDPKFQVDGVAPTNHSFSQKTRINYLSYHIKI